MESNVLSAFSQILSCMLFYELLTIKLSGIIVIPVLQMWELQPKEIKCLA